MISIKKGEVVSDPFHLVTGRSTGQMWGLTLAWGANGISNS